MLVLAFHSVAISCLCKFVTRLLWFTMLQRCLCVCWWCGYRYGYRTFYCSMIKWRWNGVRCWLRMVICASSFSIIMTFITPFAGFSWLSYILRHILELSSYSWVTHGLCRHSWHSSWFGFRIVRSWCMIKFTVGSITSAWFWWIKTHLLAWRSAHLSWSSSKSCLATTTILTSASPLNIITITTHTTKSSSDCLLIST